MLLTHHLAQTDSAYCNSGSDKCSHLIIDREAGEIIRLVASVCVFVCVFVCLSVRALSRSIQNGWAFKMVVVLTGCAIAVDHTFNTKGNLV